MSQLKKDNKNLSQLTYGFYHIVTNSLENIITPACIKQTKIAGCHFIKMIKIWLSKVRVMA